MCDSFDGLNFYKSVADRVEAKSIYEPNSGCLLWFGGINSSGYGCIGVGHKTSPVHRAHWIARCGSIPQGLHVLHRCDTPTCVNIDHLFLGSNSDNIADKMVKGRQPSVVGSANPKSRLREHDVIAIRRDARSVDDIANDYGVTPNNIRAIKKRFTWRHVP